MTNVEKYDLIVFGGGKAGKTLAMDEARAGKKVAMIEAGMIGGSCINVACIPSKTFIRSAEVAHTLGQAAQFGLTEATAEPDMGIVAARTANVVGEMVKTNQSGFDASGLELLLGWGAFVAPRIIAVAGTAEPRHVTADSIFINLGTVADIPDLPGLKDANPLTHVEALRIGEPVRKLLILGGGFIALELGQAFRRLGAEVTIIERGQRLLPREDADVAENILAAMKNEGLEVVLGCEVASVTGMSSEAVTVTAADGASFEGTHLLVATGRQPRTNNIGLEVAGVTTDQRGFIEVDDHLRTTASGIWAMGEVAGTPMFTHASLDDYRIVKSDLNGGTRRTTDRTIPYCVFIDPEYARIGLNEEDARRGGSTYRVAKLPMDVIPRARTLSRREGFMKAIVAAHTDEILGFSMLGENAGEVMSVVQMAMLGKLPYTALRDCIFAHPTISEGLNMLFANVRTPS
ncbi:FAD-dependent oxidoreductase [Sinorhizobium sp. 8-89]|uniref:dihydrolipoyl dehydrogenase family protein n=1 Tax=Sinorhizobium sp. 7-81 TaxID=3049087 RepID=UPI0024C2A44E|nr:FAD-dependent oxidoreductase [Sinorhizobium sp. 7-81]MDK1386541.1 FAD-dependent oxidoreductase [Sinorhizobium sp. 7-81]